MSLQELNKEFGGTGGKDVLPSHSEGKEYGKGRGKGMRDFEDSWDRGGKGDDRGGKGGDRGGSFRNRRDEEPSKADQGDWFSARDSERASGRFGGGGGGFGDRNRDRDRGDRDRDGDRPPRRDDRRTEKDDGAAEQDMDWRSGGRKAPEERGKGGDFAFRRDGDRGGERSSFGRGSDSGPSERPRLNLKPRTKDLPDREAPLPSVKEDEDARPARNDPFGGARAVAPKDDDDDAEDQDDKEETKEEPKADESAPKKWVPPSVRKRLEEEEKAKAQADADARKKREEQDRAAAEDKKKREEARAKEDERRQEADKKKEASDGFEEVRRGGGGGGGGGAAGKYVPPSQRKAMEEKEKKEREAREREEAEQRRQDEERERRAEIDRQKKKEAAERKAEEERRKKEAKEAAKQAVKAPKEAASKAATWDEEKVEAFGEKCKSVVDSGSDSKKLAGEVESLLGEADLKTVGPVGALLGPLMQWCRCKEEGQVVEAVARFAPLFNALLERAQVWRFKVKMLCEAQRIAYEMKLPALSPSSALLETFFDALYQAEIVEEQYFQWWADDEKDNTPGKVQAMFQVNPFLDFLRNGKFEGESDDEEEENEGGSEDEDEDEDEEEDDVEENVPKSRRR